MIAHACKMCVSHVCDVCIYLLMTCDSLPGSEATRNLLGVKWIRPRDSTSKSRAPMEDIDVDGPGLKELIITVEGW